jgi:nitroreductase
MTNPVLSAIADRRSNRAYAKDRPSKEQLDAILAAAVQSPSARNAQPWHFTVVQDGGILAEINAEVSKNLNNDVGDIFYAAPTVIFIGANVKGPTPRWALLDCGIAVQTIALAAHSLGLGSVILGMPDAAFAGPRGDYFKKLVKLPEGYEFGVAIAVGAALDAKDAHPVEPDKISYAVK